MVAQNLRALAIEIKANRKKREGQLVDAFASTIERMVQGIEEFAPKFAPPSAVNPEASPGDKRRQQYQMQRRKSMDTHALTLEQKLIIAGRHEADVVPVRVLKMMKELNDTVGWPTSTVVENQLKRGREVSARMSSWPHDHMYGPWEFITPRPCTISL